MKNVNNSLALANRKNIVQMSKKLILPGLVTLGLLMNANAVNAGMMDEPVVSKFTMDKLEVSDTEGNPKQWELDFWVMQGLQRLVIKSEGESVDGDTDSENMLMYGQGIAPYWDIQVGLAHDTRGDESHSWAAVGLAGMAPYFFETEVYALVDSDGTLGLRASTEYEALITQKLVLVPEITASAYSDDIPEIGIGAGLSAVNLSLRLKYEIKREFAPYIGINWHKKLGNTADMSSEEEETSLVAGISFWF